MGRVPRDQDERFWEKVDKSGDCWLWTASTTWGYGAFRTRAPRDWVKAHRYSYERLVGPIPVGLQLDHLCRNRRCVRPDHLEPVTQRENLMRGDTLPARAAAKLICDYGHDDWRQRRDGSRFCRTCANAAKNRAYHAKRHRLNRLP